MGWNATHSCQKELFLPYHWSQRDMKLSLWVVQGPAGYAIPGIPTACGEWVRPAQLQQRLTHFNPGSNWACPSWVYCHFWMRSRPYMHLSLVIHDPAIIVTHPWPWSTSGFLPCILQSPIQGGYCLQTLLASACLYLSILEAPCLPCRRSCHTLSGHLVT